MAETLSSKKWYGVLTKKLNYVKLKPMITFGKRQHLVIQIAAVAILGINFFWLHWPLLGVLGGVFYLFINSKKLGDIIFNQLKVRFKNILGLLTILIYLSLIYTLTYHVYKINAVVFLFTLISIPLFAETMSWKLSRQHYFFNELDLSKFRMADLKNAIIPIVFLVTELLNFILLFKRASQDVLRSPWEILDHKFWILLIISTVLLVTFILQNKKAAKSLFLVAVHFLLISSVALITYPLGFGYDPFIHQATMKVIADTGTIQPRLFLYLGQYGWTFFLKDLLQLSLDLTNKLIMPFAFSLLWPYTLYYSLRYGFNWPKKISLLSVLLSIFIGFNFAIMTTPQNLAFLLAAVFVFLLPFMRRKPVGLYLAGIMAIGVITIHPLAGIPLLYLVALLIIQRLPIVKLWRQILYIFGLIVAAVSLPALLAVYQKINGRHWSQIFTFHSWPLFEFPGLKFYSQYSFPLDSLHNIWDNRVWIYLIIVIIGLILIIKNHKYLFFKKHLLLLILLLANYLLARLFISFDVQINYEQNAYLNRILYLMGLTVLPIWLTTFYFWWRPYTDTIRLGWYKIWLTTITVVIIVVSVYFSYPIYDRHGNSKSFNLTKADLEIVNLIEQTANGQPYVVLANQMVGVGAINTFGFAHYYPTETNDNFYYSMPLGKDNIYQNYLNMIEKQASREEALVAMDKAQVDQLYFVVNNYWHSAKTAIVQAKNTADNYFMVAGGKNYVFVYSR